MRGILFRGFHPDKNGAEKVIVNGKFIKGFWVYGDLRHRESSGKCFVEIITKCDGHDNYKYFYVIPKTVGQYTGLEDENGKKIFDGDILICKRYVGGNFIEYHLEKGYVEMKHGAFGLHRKQGFYRPFKDWLEDYEYELIGNAHSNPELLEE